MPTNKKPAKKAAPQKAKAVKAAPKKAAKPAKVAPKKAAKPAAKQVKPAKPQAKKAIAKPVKKAAPAKKAPVKPVVSAKKAEPKVKPEAVKKAVNTAQPQAQVKTTQVAEIKKPAVKEKAKAEDVKPSKPVVIPKLSTNNARKYEPEFTQSVLDRPAAQQNGPVMRYSDAELTEFKELIQRKLDAAKKELSYLQGLITRKDDMGGDESENRYMTMEDGSISMEREQLSQMASRQIQYIDHLEKAMMRIENKTYGICRVTGKLIDKARLRAVPHATLSIEAKMGYAKNPNIQ
ncbi:transcriptional regulator, TraR/DksA family protein [Terrimonas sp.]|uniref:TraR/DksA family transcriptional regulator n=1 Tax=Terrimonas sp. TaxID=1914338 RepID=UPI000D516207|nr:TraR/DksA C4-type zinc finger protein [Terrimonas sp.]PVD51158.1 transcriptional regulator, TraR/DksA family protein [Terrimonas sp.]